MTQMEFVDIMLGTARKQGMRVAPNRNADRQIDTDKGGKKITEHHLRLLFQDVGRKNGLYTRADMEELVKARPCAVAPFFELAEKAGLCNKINANGVTVYVFAFAFSPALSAARSPGQKPVA